MNPANAYPLALELYAKQAMNTDAERQACEVRLRAEKRAGLLLSEKERSKGGRPSETCPTNGQVSEYQGTLEKAATIAANSEYFPQQLREVLSTAKP